MDSKHSSHIVISVVLALLVVVSSVVFIMNLNRTKPKKKYFDPVIINNCARAKILDCNGEILSMDQPMNYVVFNTNRLENLAEDKKKSVYSVISREFSIDSFREKVEKYKGQDIGIKSGFDVVEKLNLKKLFKDNKLDKYLTIQEENRRIFSNRVPDSIKRFLGKVDEETRNGINGIEKKYNDYLKSKEGIQASVSDGHDVTLSIDLPLVELLDKSVSEQDSDSTAIVFNITNGSLAGISSNINDTSTKLSDYLLPSLEKLSIFSSYGVLAMIESDLTLLEPYYCEGSDDCKIPHKNVDLLNWINCKGALLSNYQNYNNSDLNESLFSQLDPDSMGQTDVSLITLMFLAFSPNYIPTCNFIRNSSLKSINGFSIENSSSPEYYTVSLSSKGQKYIREILENNICPQVIGFVVNNAYYVLLYQKNGINKNFYQNIKKDLNSYSVLK